VITLIRPSAVYYDKNRKEENMANRNGRLDRLLDGDEIQQLVLRLARGTDRRDVELIESCYHKDSFDDHGGFQGSGAEFARWVPEVLSLFAVTMHFVGTPRLEFDGDVVHGETYCVAHHVFPPEDPGGERDSIMALRYLDRFERRDGGPWLIAHRRCSFDFTYMAPIQESWPLESTYVLGRPDAEDPSYAWPSQSDRSRA
jgi:hypothetical protein